MTKDLAKRCIKALLENWTTDFGYIKRTKKTMEEAVQLACDAIDDMPEEDDKK